MKEIVVLSGKGGTGKTTVLGSLAVLAGHAVLADCDADAADLHLLLRPEIRTRQPFFAGHEAVIRHATCTTCGACVPVCRAGAITASNGSFTVEPLLCEGCGLCVRICPAAAIDFPSRCCGELYVSDTRFGLLVHARLEPGGESSGKLVTQVRREARRLAAELGVDWLLVDGPPGIGCPVIASLSEATAVLVVTEPTPSGLHDLERVLELCRHFGVPASVCVNKWDLHPELTAGIEELARSRQAPALGRIPYDLAVTEAQVQGRPVVEVGGPAAEEITRLWGSLQTIGGASGS
ncbi:MAG TPA: ATP-binding protein [Thermoanaerobaculaceae bacterium]|nr:ATP-binding protein [Thermoanaerobaculaceae bacterium]HRS17026.1 ATP-binding protein [Thermoanaerobaculaceae bacterium]